MTNTVFAVTYTRKYRTIDGYRYEDEFKLFTTRTKAQAFVDAEIVDADTDGYNRPFVAKEAGRGDITEVEVT